MTASPVRLPAVRCELAGPADEPALRRLLREGAMGGAVQLALTREPDYFASMAGEGEADRQATFVLRERSSDQVVAMGSRSVHAVCLHGRTERLGYLGQLRMAAGRRWRRRDIAHGFAFARATRRSDELPFDLTSIVADNAPARRLLERDLPSMPRYSPLAELVTFVIPTPRRGRPTPEVRPATHDDLPAIATVLEAYHRQRPLAPACSLSQLEARIDAGLLQADDFLVIERSGRVIACAAVQDLRQHRQVLVTGYTPRLRRWRHAVNLGLRLRGRPRLPTPGTALAMGYLACVAVHDDDAATWSRLLTAARSVGRLRQLDHLVLGLCADHPAIPSIRRHIPARAYRSQLYLVHDATVSPHTCGLDGRNLHVELASL
ncbi:MAG: hypothetical protein WDZ31_07165 [Phycisphaeraceae bacterium]